MRQLQQNAAAAIRRVQRGERIEVTDRGRPVALLSPIHAGSVLDTLEAAGRIVRAEGDLLELGPPLRVSGGSRRASRRLASLRAAER